MITAGPNAAIAKTQLFFGSAVVPRRSSSGAGGSMGWVFTALLGFHKLYSRALLWSAVQRLSNRFESNLRGA